MADWKDIGKGVFVTITKSGWLTTAGYVPDSTLTKELVQGAKEGISKDILKLADAIEALGLARALCMAVLEP